MPEYTPEQKAKVNALAGEAFRNARRRTKRNRPSKLERAIAALGNVADDFEGAERDQISLVIQLLTERAER